MYIYPLASLAKYLIAANWNFGKYLRIANYHMAQKSGKGKLWQIWCIEYIDVIYQYFTQFKISEKGLRIMLP